ncbi:MAG: galactokinase [Armatimonadota bacterium]
MDRRDLAAWAATEARERTGRNPEIVAVAPGRVELLGNHTDYNEGWVLTAAVDAATGVAVSPRTDGIARLHSAHDGYPDVAFPVANMNRASGPERWSNYVRGTVAELAAAGVGSIGFDAAIVSTVPDGSGVSSSAALLVAVARALEALDGREPMDPMAMAQLCRRAENGPFVGAPVGLLDQFSSACGRAGHALLLDCRTLRWDAVPLPGDACSLLIANSGVRHELAAGGGYADRRAACFRVARTVSNRPDASLRDVTRESLEARAADIDREDLRRATHVLDENDRVLAGAKALEAGDWATFGAIMVRSHESCRSLFENSCPEVDALVEAALGAGAYGAKLTGGGWGGAAIIAHAPDRRAVIEEALRAAWSRRFSGSVQLMATSAAAGASAERFPS